MVSKKIDSKIAFIMLMFYFVDIILTGSGQWFRIGSVSTRILWFGLAGVFSLPLLYENRKILLKNKYVIAVIGFLLWIAAGTFKGFASHNPTDHIIEDITGFLNYLLLPTMLCTLSTEGRKEKLSMAIIGCCLIGTVGISYLSFYPLLPDPPKAYNWVAARGLAGITQITTAATRVFFHTLSRYLFVAYILVLYRIYQQDSFKKNMPWILALGFLIYGIFISYTRAIYAGCFLGVVALMIILLIKRDSNWKKILNSVILSGIIALVLIGSSSVILNENLVSAAVNRVLLSIQMPDYSDNDNSEMLQFNSNTSGEMNSDNQQNASGHNQHTTDISKNELNNLDVRAIKLSQLGEQIKENPVFGNGLGKSIAYADGRVEYSYHDILNKLGILGLLLFFSPFLLELYDVIMMPVNNKQRKNILLFKRSIAISIMVYFFMIAYFNPCMNTTLGISVYLMTMVFCQENSNTLQ